MALRPNSDSNANGLREGEISARKPQAKAAPIQLLTASTLPTETVKRLIKCYADGNRLKETEAICGVSHVTVSRIFHLIRKRLLYVRIFQTRADFVAEQLEIEEDDGPYFAGNHFRAFMNARLSQHRGIKPWNRDLYEAEVVFHCDHNVTPGQLYRLITLSIKAAGPLNKAPNGYNVALIEREMYRLNMQAVRQLARAMGGDKDRQAFITTVVNG